MLIKPPELTLITSDYANDLISELNFIKNGKKISPKKEIKENFFILWLPLNDSEDSLIESIKEFHSGIPVDKSITCSIRLAYPKTFLEENNRKFKENINNNNNQNNQNNYELIKTIAKIIPISLITKFLIKISILEKNCSNSFYFWSLGLKLVLQLISEGNFILSLEEISKNNHESEYEKSFDSNGNFETIKTFKTQWKPILRSSIDFANFGKILKYATLSSHCILRVRENDSNSLYSEKDILIEFMNNMTDMLVRKSLKSNDFGNFSKIYGVSPESIFALKERIPWDVRLLSSLMVQNSEFNIYKSSEMAVPNIIKKWLMFIDHPYWNVGYNITLKLKIPEDTENWELGYYLESITDEKTLIGLEDFWKIIEGEPKIIKKYSQKFPDLIQNKWKIRNNVLSALYGLITLFSPIEESLKKVNPNKAVFNVNEASQLLEYAGSQISADGFNFIVPEIFDKTGKQRIKPVMRIFSINDKEEKTQRDTIEEKELDSTKAPYQMSFDASSLLQYEWEINLGESQLSKKEIKELFNQKDPLVKINNEWVFLDRKELKIFKEIFKDEKGGTIRGDEALFHGLSGEKYIKKKENGVSKDFGPYEVQIEGTAKEVIDILTGKRKQSKFGQPQNLNGTLRKYQQKGFDWISSMTNIGFGVCLADDMGLGKTIQVITYILSQYNHNNELRCLITCPTSVLGNWKREFEKFAPDLPISFYYGNNRPKDLKELLDFIKNKKILLTTYGLLRRDGELLEKIEWDVLVLDESQNIKNYKTKQAQSAFNLRARARICMTGTPIENRLSELWSQYHFTNPFLLGDYKDFQKKYQFPIERLGNLNSAQRLRKYVTPFFLRRLKTDKTIIKDLPEKNEIKVFINFTELQKKLYTETVNESLEKIDALKEIQAEKGKALKRSSVVLNTIMKLKQICNHPYQALKIEDSELNEYGIEEFINKSSKIQRIMEMLEELIQSKDKVLIFTQFKVMGDYLEWAIQEKLRINTLFLHGGVSQKNRTKMVESFQDDFHYEYPLFILSLKAGGTGLNLTAASTVIHFDRWWNPAVENQATDRAYRIGQKKNVNVYKPIVSGTIEEKIDKLIEQKKDLADMIISTTGENWITELNDDDLRALFSLEDSM